MELDFQITNQKAFFLLFLFFLFTKKEISVRATRNKLFGSRYKPKVWEENQYYYKYAHKYFNFANPLEGIFQTTFVRPAIWMEDDLISSRITVCPKAILLV